jgi:transposase-like protein
VSLYVEDQAPEEVAARYGMSLNALYSWRSRFKSRVDVWLKEEEGR